MKEENDKYQRGMKLSLLESFSLKKKHKFIEWISPWMTEENLSEN